jgi:hypothetical protein
MLCKEQLNQSEDVKFPFNYNVDLCYIFSHDIVVSINVFHSKDLQLESFRKVTVYNTLSKISPSLFV